MTDEDLYKLKQIDWGAEYIFSWSGSPIGVEEWYIQINVLMKQRYTYMAQAHNHDNK